MVLIVAAGGVVVVVVLVGDDSDKPSGAGGEAQPGAIAAIGRDWRSIASKNYKKIIIK